MTDKSKAILRLANLANNWLGWISFNEEKQRMTTFLDDVVEDVFQGYITYEAFQETFINVSEQIGRAEGDFVDDCLLYVKKKIISKYSVIDYIS